MIQFVLMDIEGTTTSVSFVFDVLFPYFRDNIQSIASRAEEPEIAAILKQVQDLILAKTGISLDQTGAIATLHQWSVEDRKVPPLKAMQGFLWEEGYKNGDFRGHVYPDVLPKLKEWQKEGIQLGIYSSGSVKAQKLLFGYSDYGDLTGYFNYFFDLKVGQKRDVQSYQAIAQTVQLPPEAILFLSDVPAELDAAIQAGYQAWQLVRPGTTASPTHQQVTDFGAITSLH
ncbi:acireductone synthase [Picosynechococcus sp. PCC 11901]|uniref:acireductone synthase n=1 Tax=Picosynechococcus sp. PCC 11901 TaxID=2579791 RepID=UPI0010FBD0F7|nr:acireductone synthase [Picosynechococcus sp. PCC 11901]QCS49173.1 acireductone synthase [Picosynechococcus sp. PCC 11901]